MAVCFGAHTTLVAQSSSLPTRGREFWLGFMQNAYGAQALRIYINATVATSGTVSMPLQGWSVPFTATANSTTLVVVPATAEHLGSEVVSGLGVFVSAQDSVTVTAASFQSFTTDAAQILPVAGMGTAYRAQAYRGLPGFADFYKSELLIVASADGTQIQITPSVNTSGGHAAGVPFTVNLNEGQTYQVQGALAALDLTGTSIVGTAANGPCRPFAVYGGSMCANVPVGCPACDHVFEQMIPTDKWGTSYHTVPMGTASQWTTRITADQNGTLVSVNGGAPIALSAGQSLDVNGVAAPECFSSNLPINVAQIMEGYNCAASGDPSMVLITPDTRMSQSAQFSTVPSTQITQHRVLVVTTNAGVNQLTLDGAAVSASSFLPYAACAGYSYAVLNIANGGHRLASPTGFIAYAVGTGTGESYAFAVGNNAPPIQLQDSLICSSDPITLTCPNNLVNAYWVAQSDTTVVLATGTSYTFTPSVNDTYTVHAELPLSGCPYQFSYNVGLPVNPNMLLTANGNSPGSICQFEEVQLNAAPAPDPLWYDVQWGPAALVSDPSIPNPIAFPTQTTWFTLNVTSPVGCGSFTDSVQVVVAQNGVYDVHVSANDSAICLGQTATLQAQVEVPVASDPLDISTGTMWGSIQGGALSTACGSVSGNALRFNGAAAREVQTIPLNVNNGGYVHFSLKIANATAPCDDADPGEDIRLEYDTGLGWFWMANFNEASYPAFTSISVPVPLVAQSAATRFRWRQLAHSGAGQDNWALDNVVITRVDNSTATFDWSPSAQVNNSTIANPIATPTATGWFTVEVVGANPVCAAADSIQIVVQPAFSITTSNDTTVCQVTAVQLSAVPNSGSSITYAWTPNNGTLNSASSATPIATPTTTTTYTVLATSGIGCTATGSTTISVGNLTGATITASDNQLCGGESTQLSAVPIGSGTYTYSWTPVAGLSNATIANPVATPTANTTYTCTITSSGSSCQASGSVSINVHGPYGITTTPDTSMCSTIGYQMGVQHTVPTPFTIVWSNANLLNSGSIAAPVILFDTTNTFVVTITDAFNCHVSDTININSAFDNLITPISVGACEGQSLVLDAGYPGSMYDWTTTETTQAITVTTDAQYVATITDTAGCVTYKVFNATFHPLPVVDLGADTTVCGATSLLLDAGNLGSMYLWSTNATSQQITASTNGSYWVRVTSANNCISSDTVAVNFAAMPVDLLQNVTTCISAPPTLNAGNNGSSYLWNTTATSQSITPSVSGTYSVTITSPQNCVATYDAIVTLAPIVSVDLGPDTSICSGDALLLDAGNPGSTYAWSTTATAQTITVNSSNTYSVQVSNGYCSDTDDLILTVVPALVDGLVDVTSCIDQPVVLDAGNAGCSYSWSTNATSQTITVTTAGTYSVTVMNAIGCSDTFDATVSFVGYPVVYLGPDTVLCEGDVLVLDAGNPGAQFNWSNGDNTQTIPVTTGGTYSVSVSNGYCTSTDAILTTFNPSPARMAAHELFTCLDEEPHYVIIDAGNTGSAFDWSTGENTQVILAGAYGWYFVEVTNPYDCRVRDSVQVHEYCPSSIFIPNTFTPNGDGTNDTFLPVGKNIAQLDMYVFDRWGNVLFESHDPTIGWDGRSNGVLVPADVYVWRMTYRFSDGPNGPAEGKENQQLGHITVLL